ncbi:MAG: hypothetical protein ACMG6S_31290 [Byssovorax sp.]
MRNPFDQLAKKVGKEALDASGVTVIQHEISRDAQHADLLHDPDPAREAERARLGLLGRVAAVLCLLEIYGHAPDGAELRACLAKHFAYWEERERKTRAQNKKRKEKRLPAEPLIEPLLWLIAAVVSASMVRKLKLQPAPGWPPGVYFFGDDLFRMGIVVASELPRDRSTLLVRIMAAGPGLPQAIADLAALPADAHERTVAGQILVHLQHALGKQPSRTPEEEAFIMSMQDTWAEAREIGRNEGRDEGRNEGRDEGLREGRAEEAARAVLTVLRVRGIVVPDAFLERILAQKDLERLERWLEKAAIAASVVEAIDEPS